MGDKTSLGDRMKKHESVYKFSLPHRMPIVCRLDGKAFHTYTSGCKELFCKSLNQVMDQTAIKLCKEIQGAQMAYVQSDEISILIHPYKKFASQAWFDNEVQKISSVTAGIASSTFTMLSDKISFNGGQIKPAVFDSRVFGLPENEVCNYLVWRQKDCERNSISSAAQYHYSAKELHGKNSQLKKEMLLRCNYDWEMSEPGFRFGRTILPTETFEGRKTWAVSEETLVFSEQRKFVNDLLLCEE